MQTDDGEHVAFEPARSVNPNAAPLLHPYINIHEYYGFHDVRAAVHIQNLISRSPKAPVLFSLSPLRDWQRWGEGNVIAIGGNTVTWNLFAHSQHPVEFRRPDTFIVEGNPFRAEYPCDYGVICRLRDRTTLKSSLVIVGLGGVGTEAAALFLYRNAATISKLFPASGFSILIRTSVELGVAHAQPVWSWPQPTWLSKKKSWLAWRRWEDLCNQRIDCPPPPFSNYPGRSDAPGVGDFHVHSGDTPNPRQPG